MKRGIVVSDKAREGQRRRSRRYFERHPERVRRIRRAVGKRYWSRHKDDIRKRRWLKRFGISADVYDKLFTNQGSKCAICKRVSVEACAREKFLSIDHDHKTGKVRGLLCSICNRGLGHFKDSPELLEEAAVYLRRTS